MADINAAIPLQVQNQPSFSLGDLAQMMQFRRQQQTQNSLLSIFQSPGAMDATGMPTPETIRKVGMMDPSMGMNMLQGVAKVSESRAQQGRARAAMNKDNIALVNQANTAGLEAYDEALKSGLSDQQSLAKAQDVYAQARDQLAKGGMLSPDQVSAMPSQFNPMLARGQALTYNQYKMSENRDATQDRLTNQMANTQRHQEVMENLAESRLSLAEQRAARAEANSQGSPGGKIDPDTLSVMADQYLAGDNSVFTNLGRGKQGAENVIALRKTIMQKTKDQGLTGGDVANRMAEFQGAKAGQRALGTRTANVEMAVNEADQMADLALEASNKFGRTGFVPINRAIMSYESNTGDEAARQFGAANLSFINAYSRAISPTGTPTVSDKEHAREILSTADSPQAYTAVIQQMKREMAAAKKSPEMVKEEFRSSAPGTSSKKSSASSKDYSHLWGG